MRKVLIIFLTIGVIFTSGCTKSTEIQNNTNKSDDASNSKTSPHVNTISDQTDANNVNLNEWVGDYGFYEFCPPNINMMYGINIYKENGCYFAKINIDGFQTIKRIKAKVLGDQDVIHLDFETYLPDSMGDDLSKDDVLLSFKKVDSEIFTNWGKIEPILPENKGSGKVYFTKVKE